MSTESKETLVGESSSRAAEPEKKKTIILMASDGDEFVVDAADIANQSVLIKTLISDLRSADGLQVPLLNVTGPVLAKLLELLSLSATTNGDREAMQKIIELMKADMNMMIDVLLAANYVEATSFFHLLCKAMADKLKDMSADAVREFLGIECDFTEEELQQIRADSPWAFE
ncbi:hypothetical protein BHM03_00043956 [Ensete ventricosum]|nr:hypothetical protein BHM03_00043956 [Ensete ventricosum]